MRIELNAGGLGGLVSIADFQLNMKSAYNSVKDVIEAFQSVGKSVCNLSGGVGNLQDVQDNIQARIELENQKIVKIETIQRTTNDFLSLAISVDKQVAKKIDSNKHEFYGKYEWSRPSIKNTLKNVWNGLKGAFNDVKDFLKDTKDALVDWYENHGGKEILNILWTVTKTVLAVAGFVVSVLALTPPLTAIGVAGLCISVAALEITAADAQLDICNEVQAFGKKREALKAESGGDYETAEKLRSEASKLSDESSWRDRWRNDGKNDIWDAVATVTDVVEILDIVHGGSEVISGIGKAGSVSKWLSEGFSATSQLEKLKADKVAGNLKVLSNLKVVDFAINSLVNFPIGFTDKVSNSTITVKNDSIGFNVETPKLKGGTFDLFVPILSSPIISKFGIGIENLKNFFK